MKNYVIKSGLLLLIGFLFTSFTIIKIDKKEVDVSKSSLEWVGSKVTSKHNGTINLKSGFFNFEGKKLIGGSFVIDMSSIVCTDLQGQSKSKLEGHLKSDDFFGVANFSESHFKITKIGAYSDSKYKVTGELTIKGITHINSFDITFNDNTATGTVVVDRTMYDIKYGSGSFFDNLGDKTISDNFELQFNLVF